MESDIYRAIGHSILIPEYVPKDPDTFLRKKTVAPNTKKSNEVSLRPLYTDTAFCNDTSIHCPNYTKMEHGEAKVTKRFTLRKHNDSIVSQQTAVYNVFTRSVNSPVREQKNVLVQLPICGISYVGKTAPTSVLIYWCTA